LPSAIGPYQVSGELGRGAFGVVYQGLDPALKREVAIKVLHRGALGSSRTVARFLREAQVVAGMHHNHIVPVYQLGEHEGGYYIATRLIRGPTLGDVIPEEGMPAAQAVELIRQLLDALAHAHDGGVIHRDVKPENMLLDEEGQLYLTDFGLAGFVDGAQMTQEGALLGTPAYMAPEQTQGKQQGVGAAGDQYSAGVVLYELLTGHQPFEGVPLSILIHNIVHTPPPPLTDFRPDLEAPLQAICLKALAKRAEDRFPDCRAMARALHDWQAASAASPAPVPRREEPENVLDFGKGEEKARRGVEARATVEEESGRPRGRAKTRDEADLPPGIVLPPIPPPPPTSTRVSPLERRQPSATDERLPGRQRRWKWLAAVGPLVALGVVVGVGVASLRKGSSPIPALAPEERFDLETVAEIVLKAGDSVVVPISLRRRDYQGGVRLHWEGLPEGVTADGPPPIHPGENHTEARLRADQGAPPVARTVRLVAIGQDCRREHEVSFTVSLHPIRLTFEPKQVLLEPGAGQDVKVTINRPLADLRCRESNIPRDVTARVGELLHKSGQTTAQIRFQAGRKAQPASGALTLTAVVAGSGLEKQGALEVQVEPPALVLSAALKVRLLPGTTRVPVRIERGDYEGSYEVTHQWKGGEEVSAVTVNQSKGQTFLELQVPLGPSPGEGWVRLQAKVGGRAAGRPIRVEYEVRIDRVLREKGGNAGEVYSVAFSPDGKTLASGSRDQTIKLWGVSTGKCTTSLTGHTRVVHSVAFSPDGKTLASGSRDQTIKLWDVSTGKCTATLTGHTESVYSVAFSPDGKTLASCSGDQTIKLWGVSTGECTASLTGHTASVRSVTFSPDGKTLASGSGDQTIKLWGVSTGECTATLTGHTATVYSVAFSPDGKTLASGSWPPAIKLWEVSTGKNTSTLTGHTKVVHSVAFSPDGKTLASCSGDQTIQLWDVSTGKCTATLTGHTESVYSVAFSPDGKTLALASSDSTVRIWDVSGFR
jgi:serine/threonine protein kinase/Tol biopolymer transport system component